jgi:hypothetical protein
MMSWEGAGIYPIFKPNSLSPEPVKWEKRINSSKNPMVGFYDGDNPCLAVIGRW